MAITEVPPEADVRRRVNQSLAHLLERDLFLLQQNAHERTITHRLAIYLEDAFPGWHVDCEYNRQSDQAESKVLDEVYSRLIRMSRHADLDADDSLTVFPDIIIHQRGERQNLLVLEVKKAPARQCDDHVDRLKLEGYLGSDHLRYSYGAFVRIPVGTCAGNTCEIEWS